MSAGSTTLREGVGIGTAVGSTSSETAAACCVTVGRASGDPGAATPSATPPPITAMIAKLPTSAPAPDAAPIEIPPSTGAAITLVPAVAWIAAGSAGMISDASAAVGCASEASSAPPATPPSSSGIITSARCEPTSSTSSEMRAHFVQPSRWSSTFSFSRGVSPLRVRSPSRDIVHRQSAEVPSFEMWACNHAVRSPSRAR